MYSARTMSKSLLSPYSASWPRHYQELRHELRTVFVALPVEIEHIGSTSVPGLVAKPVIDVLLGAPSLGDVESRIEAIGALGYDYVSRYESELPMRRYFVRPATTMPRIHLHAVELHSEFWRAQLAFRDLLRSDVQLRSEYQTLKLELAERFAGDKSAYTAAKGPFIEAVLASLGSAAAKPV
jgi:GrpB-like predicted nucleotidyltransferase (UPF0157 family)